MSLLGNFRSTNAAEKTHKIVQRLVQSFFITCREIQEMALHDTYPVIVEGYGVFITPVGGYIFPYEVYEGVKRPLPQCKSLNVQACAILEYCTGSHTVEEICSILEKKFEETPSDLSSQVASFLGDVLEKGYIQYSDTPKEEGFIQGSIDYYTPSQILVETTSCCNLMCGHCYMCAGQPLSDELSSEQFIPLLERLFHMGVNLLDLSGGEILTKKGWDSLADFCDKRGSPRILSNGTLITEERAGKIARYGVSIGLYGKDADTHEKITGVKGSFRNTIKGITLLVEGGASVVASILMVPFNMHQLEDIVQLAISLKCSHIQVGVICPVGRARNKQWELSEYERDVLDKRMKELKQNYKEIDIRWEEEKEKGERGEKGGMHTCGAGFVRWVIASNGDVFPCATFRVSIGNLTQKDPVDICKSDAVTFLQRLGAPHTEMCGDCQYLYACWECHAQAFAHFLDVDNCKWANQFENAPEPFKRAVWEKYKTNKTIKI